VRLTQRQCSGSACEAAGTSATRAPPLDRAPPSDRAPRCPTVSDAVRPGLRGGPDYASIRCRGVRLRGASGRPPPLLICDALINQWSRSNGVGLWLSLQTVGMHYHFTNLTLKSFMRPHLEHFNYKDIYRGFTLGRMAPTSKTKGSTNKPEEYAGNDFGLDQPARISMHIINITSLHLSHGI